jgi:NTP pyrophosphatase (non-canonical NTP hydrolase)
MEKEERIGLYKKAIDTWGSEAQMHMVFEECGELINALAKVYRGRSSGKDVITELADVSIMIEQMATMLGFDAYEAEKENKLIRLKERLEKYGKH